MASSVWFSSFGRGRDLAVMVVRYIAELLAFWFVLSTEAGSTPVYVDFGRRDAIPGLACLSGCVAQTLSLLVL